MYTYHMQTITTSNRLVQGGVARISEREGGEKDIQKYIGCQHKQVQCDVINVKLSLFYGYKLITIIFS